MWSPLNASFAKTIVHSTIVGFGGRNKGTNHGGVVYRDELNNNQYSSPKKLKKTDCLASRVRKDDEQVKKRSSNVVKEEKGVIRVKVKMTKEEAARLMSKCKDGGVIEFRDVAKELVQIPINRVSVVSSRDIGCGSVLKTIPEEI